MLFTRLPSLLALGALSLVGVGCSTGAKGVDACRAIESRRCELAPRCADFAKANALPVIATADDVARCKEFYHDQCLNGVENAGDDAKEPTTRQTDACTAAITAMVSCAGAASLAGCADAPLVDGIDPSQVTACGVLLGEAHPAKGSTAGVEVLAACAFVEAPDEPATSSSTTSTGGTGGAGGAGGSGGSR